VRQQAERLAVNTPIQGTAADLIKKAMIDIGSTIRQRRLRTRMVLQIHDELLFEGPSGEMEEVREIVREGMENVVPLSVPLRVDIGSGKNWAEAH
ncbi:MAG TPA: DNA polymerase, partial [Dissulfurispiraceae bacterium]|nr:DNA polymerase [Dissulfurispiraceae bacterium]